MTCLPITFFRKSFGDPLTEAADTPFLIGAAVELSSVAGSFGVADAITSVSAMLILSGRLVRSLLM